MNSTVLLAIALAIVLAGVAGSAITYILIRRRVGELEREAARLQGDIEMRMGHWQETEALKQQFSGRAGPHASPGHTHGPASAPRTEAFQTTKEGTTPTPYSDSVGERLAASRTRLRSMTHDRQAAQAPGEDQGQEAVRNPPAAQRHTAPRGAAAAPGERVPTSRGPNRGRWGELSLWRILELAGMTEYCHFEVLPADSARSPDNGPDVIVHLPDSTEMRIDGDIQLHRFINAIHAVNNGARSEQMRRFAQHLHQRIDALAEDGKRTRETRPEAQLALFIPGEQFLSAALEATPGLDQRAEQAGVMLITPHRLLALLREAATGWQRRSMAANVERMHAHSRNIRDQIAAVSEHLARVGHALQASQHTGHAGADRAGTQGGRNTYNRDSAHDRAGTTPPSPSDRDRPGGSNRRGS